jgi:hypothetical protein
MSIVPEEPLNRLTRDLIKATTTMSEQEARYLVDAYYLMQDDRKRAHNQVRAMTAEPHTVIAWLATNSQTMENQIKRALEAYTDAKPVGVWMKSIYGIGPVIAAGMLAHIDITRSPTVGHIYSFAGIAGADQKKWEKGKKRPFNADLRTLCWKVGQSFMKFHKEDACVYGHVYRAQKDVYVAHNEAGDYREAAARALVEKKYDKDTEAFAHYTAGHLPPAQIDARARRYATKRFLSHMHAVMYWNEYQQLPPNPYALDHLGHAHFVMMPNVELVPGLQEALKKKGLI